MSTTPTRDTLRAPEARLAARMIAWGPFVFQTARCLRDLGVLTALKTADPDGLSLAAVAEASGLSTYGATVLLEAGASFDLVKPGGPEDGLWFLTKTGYYILEDRMTRVNMDFVHDVNYQGMFHLEEALKRGVPAGLPVFGDWPTIYEGLSRLPPQAQRSWFAFDHYYSDAAFPEVLPLLFERPPARLMDVGGNTGRWASACLAYDETVRITIVDLPQQLDVARANLEAAGGLERVDFVGMDLLDPTAKLPKGHDAIWMSQFLCCFPEADVTRLLARAREAVAPGGAVVVLETFCDRQPHPVAKASLCASSLYFTVMANGTSRIYDAETMRRCAKAAGLRVEREVDDLGVGRHTLFVCKPD